MQNEDKIHANLDETPCFIMGSADSLTQNEDEIRGNQTDVYARILFQTQGSMTSLSTLIFPSSLKGTVSISID